MDILNIKVKDKLQNVIREHMKKLNTLLENKNELQYNYDSLVKKESNVTEELSSSKDKKMDIDKEIKELKQELIKNTDKHSKEILELEVKLEKLINESSDLTTKIIRLEEEKQSIQTELDNSKQRISELEKENKNYLKTIQKQQKEIDNKLKQIELLNNQTEILKNETHNDTKIQDFTSNNNLLLASKEEELKLIKEQLKDKEKELLEQLKLFKAMEEQVEEYTRENNEINKIIDNFELESDALFNRAGQYSNNQVAKIRRSNTSNIRLDHSNHPNIKIFDSKYNSYPLDNQLDNQLDQKIEKIKTIIYLIQSIIDQLVADGDTSFDQNIRYVTDTIDIINRRLESDNINLESLIENIQSILDVCNSAKKTNDQNYKKQFCYIHELFMQIYKIIDPDKELFNQIKRQKQIMNTDAIEKNSRLEETSESLSNTSQDSSMLTTIKNNEVGQSVLQLIAARADREDKLRKSEVLSETSYVAAEDDVALKEKKIKELDNILLNLNGLVNTTISISNNKSLKQNIKKLEEIIKLLNSINFDKNNKEFSDLYDKIVRICNTKDNTYDNEYKKQFCDIKRLVDEIIIILNK